MILLAKKQRRSVLWLCLAIAAVWVLLSVAQLFMTPAILRAVENDVSVGGLVGTVLSFTAALMVLHGGSAYLASCAQFGRIGLRLKMAGMIQNKVLTMSYPNVEDETVRRKKEKAAMLVRGSQCATETIWATLTETVKCAADFLICLSVLSALRPVLVLAVLATSVVSFSVSGYLNGWGYRHRAEEAEYSRRMSYLSEKSRDYTLAKDVCIFGLGSWIEDVFHSTLRLFKSFTARGERVYIWGNIVDALLTFLRNGLAYAVLASAAFRGEMPAAQFVFYFNAVTVFAGGIGGVMNSVAALRRQSLDISAVREFLDLPEVFQMEGGVSLVPNPDTPYKIEFKDVSFRYPGAESDALSHIDLTILPGEKLAVVGLNGAGKTTLIKLMCGFLDPTGGRVLLNGTDIKTYNRRDYYRLFSAVFQDYSVLDATLAENIAQTAENIDVERLNHCIALAGLTGKIAGLPSGVRTHLGKVFTDGVALSGGELQRLMLARALYKNAPIIVLDEPTSALDPIAESELYNKYNELTAGRLAVYISHRLASTQFCDRIILIADGRIAEEGTHDRLMARKGRYAELFEVQSRYYWKEAR